MHNCIVVVLCILHHVMSLEPVFIEIESDEDLDLAVINKGLDLFDGDIMQTKTRVPRNAILNRKHLWDNPVHYVLDDLLTMNAKGVILQAFEQFRLKSCIDFKPRMAEEYYLSITDLKGCFSSVSRLYKDGQIVSIGERCDRLGIVEHEILHALGLYHEQSRYDRDDYITIMWENINYEYKGNFKKLSPSLTTTFNAPYDYMSVMHYGKNHFSSNSKNTIVTKLPEYQDRIGQRMEMSPTDVYKLNRLYNCNTSISFMEHCNFSNADICGMSYCKKGLAKGWTRMSFAPGKPFTDHTNLHKMDGKSYFMHASTASGQEGDSFWLETKRMNPTRKCHVQCLQFYYYHSGSPSDQLNIWIREFQDERNSIGNLHLMGQITGEPTYQWQFHKVPLNASKSFQVVFEVRKGNKESSGGFSIDDINLSESECPHYVWQINNFERILTSSNKGYLYSPRGYSAGGYSYQIVIALRKTYFGVYFRLVSDDSDSTLEWPCPWRQVTVIMLDKNPHIQKQMSKQISLSTDPSFFAFENPRILGKHIESNGESLYVNPSFGMKTFLSLEQIRSRDYLKGGTAVFFFSMRDISSLQESNTLPCPKHPPSNFTTTYPNNYEKGPCDTELD
ncbi:meprin A subunit beta isoform X2 [Larimichthys crocea]|uniref:meprin A subunit beta isoform X2 n=1 Tax=Larimichthys crocea TaxID=215358 RepID=UPI000F5D958F|nr:meprin A subunit beta isoform X2 [Larimichthys crocea]